MPKIKQSSTMKLNKKGKRQHSRDIQIREPPYAAEKITFYTILMEVFALAIWLNEQLRVKKTCLVEEWRDIAHRLKSSMYYNVLQSLEDKDPRSFTLYMRLSPNFFKEILARLEPRLTKNYGKGFEPLLLGFKFAIAIR